VRGQFVSPVPNPISSRTHILLNQYNQRRCHGLMNTANTRAEFAERHEPHAAAAPESINGERRETSPSEQRPLGMDDADDGTTRRWWSRPAAPAAPADPLDVEGDAIAFSRCLSSTSLIRFRSSPAPPCLYISPPPHAAVSVSLSLPPSLSHGASHCRDAAGQGEARVGLGFARGEEESGGEGKGGRGETGEGGSTSARRTRSEFLGEGRVGMQKCLGSESKQLLSCWWWWECRTAPDILLETGASICRCNPIRHWFAVILFNLTGRAFLLSLFLNAD
jgi:hypothetical protein